MAVTVTNEDVKIALLSATLAGLGTLLLRLASRPPAILERYYTPTYTELRMPKQRWVKCQK